MHGGAELAVRRGGPSARREVDQDAAQQRQQDADADAADQQHDREVDATVGRHRVVAQRARGRERDGPATADQRGQDQQPLQHPHGARPDRDLGDAQVGGGDLGVEPVGHVADPRDRGPPHGVRPRPGHPGRHVVGERADLGVDLGPLHGRRLRDRRARAAGDAACPAAPRSRCSRRSGSGLSRESHETTGQPVARPARIRVDRSMAATTVGTPAESASASSMACARPAASERGLPVPHCLVEAGGHGAQVGLDALPGRLLVRHPAGDLGAELRRCPRPGGRWWRSPGPHAARPGRAAAGRPRASTSRRSAGTVSMWLSTTTITPAWLAWGAR